MNAPTPPFSDIDEGVRPSRMSWPLPAPCDPAHENRQALLAQIVESEILPRLLAVNAARRPDVPVAPAFDATEVAAFTDLLIGAAPEELDGFVARMRDNGLAIGPLLTDLLAPAARHLGELWCEDRCDFLDVTIATSKLKRLIAEFEGSGTEAALDSRHRALLLCLPGEQHMFGLDIVGESLRLAGWDVVIAKGEDVNGQAALVRRDWFGICGLTLSGTAGLADLAHVIATVRRASRNRDLGIIVGGQAFAGRPQLAAQVGADAVADDARAAVHLATDLLREKTRAARD